MAPPPKLPEDRVRPRRPLTGEWQHAPAEGWAGPVPPLDLDEPHPATVDAWDAWFSAPWAGFWSAADVPMLRLTARVFDNIARGGASGPDLGKLIVLLDRFGITPYGRHGLRWLPPAEVVPPAPSVPDQLRQRRQVRDGKLA